MVAHPDAVLSIFSKAAHDVVVHILRRLLTLHIMDDVAGRFDAVHPLSERTCPHAFPAVQKAADDVFAFDLFRVWGQRTVSRIEQPHSVRAGHHGLAVRAVCHFVVADACHMVVAERHEREGLHTSIVQAQPFGVKPQHQCAVNGGYRLDVVHQPLACRGREGGLRPVVALAVQRQQSAVAHTDKRPSVCIAANGHQRVVWHIVERFPLSVMQAAIGHPVVPHHPQMVAGLGKAYEVAVKYLALPQRLRAERPVGLDVQQHQSTVAIHQPRAVADPTDVAEPLDLYLHAGALSVV